MAGRKRLITKTKIAQLKILKTINSKSKLTKKDAIKLGRKINKSLHGRIAEQNY